jgi:hypothetical protein
MAVPVLDDGGTLAAGITLCGFRAIRGGHLLAMDPGLDSFSLAPNATSASIARDRIAAWLARHNWPPDQSDDLVDAASEGVTNALEHAFLQPLTRTDDREQTEAPSIRVECRIRNLPCNNPSSNHPPWP